MALDLGTGVPWVMCKQDDAPDPVVSFAPSPPTHLFCSFLLSFFKSSIKKIQHQELSEYINSCTWGVFFVHKIMSVLLSFHQISMSFVTI